MAESFACLSIEFNRRYNLALQQHVRFGSGQVTHLAKYVRETPSDKYLLYFKDLEQTRGRTVWGSYSPESVSTPATPAQLEKLYRIALYLLCNDVAFQFGVDGDKFYVALDSKDHATMLKLSY